MFVGEYLWVYGFARVFSFRCLILLLFGPSSLGDEIIRRRIDHSKAWSTRNCRRAQLKINAPQLLTSRPVRPVPVKLQRLRDQFYKVVHGVSLKGFVEADPDCRESIVEYVERDASHSFK